MNELPRLTALEMVALTLAYYGETDNRIGDALPQRVWSALYERSLIRLAPVADTGEYTTVTTEAGQDALIASLKGGADRAAA